MSILEKVPIWMKKFFLVWFPWCLLALDALGVAGVWSWPSESFDRAMRSIISIALSLFCLSLFTIWFLLLSRFRWWVRVGVVILAVAAWFGSVSQVKLTGDWKPIFLFRWERSSDPILDVQESALASELPAIDVGDDGKTDFPEYRGRRRDGVADGMPVGLDWDAKPPRLLWRQPVGGGYAAFAAVGNIVVTIEQRRVDEAVVCYDSASGARRWIYQYPAFFTEFQGGSGPRATPTIAGGRVYALGGLGQLSCLDGKTGEKIWSVNILDKNKNTRWGMCGSPLVYDNVVLVNPGMQDETARDRALIAFDRETGKQVWACGTVRTAYSSPMLATLADRRQILVFDAEGLAGYDDKGGGELWRFPWGNTEGINVSQPLVLDGDRVFISTGYNVGCAMLKIVREKDAWSVQEIWHNLRLRCKFTSPVAYQGHIYGLDEGILVCLEEKKGQLKWKGDRYGHGQLLLAGDRLVVLAESGKLFLVEASPEAPHVLGSVDAVSDVTRTWNNPAIARGRLFVRNDIEMAGFDLGIARQENKP